MRRAIGLLGHRRVAAAAHVASKAATLLRQISMNEPLGDQDSNKPRRGSSSLIEQRRAMIPGISRSWGVGRGFVVCHRDLFFAWAPIYRRISDRRCRHLQFRAKGIRRSEYNHD